LGHADIELIDEAVSMLDSIIKQVDTRMGEAKCAFVKHKLRYANDNQVQFSSLFCTSVFESLLICTQLAYLHVLCCVWPKWST